MRKMGWWVLTSGLKVSFQVFFFSGLFHFLSLFVVLFGMGIMALCFMGYVSYDTGMVQPKTRKKYERKKNETVGHSYG